MKKMKKPLIAVISTTVAAASLFALAACTPTDKPLTDEPLKATKIADYTKSAEDRAETFASGSKGWSWENGDPFNVWWKAKNVSYDGGKMSLSISEMTEKEQVWDAEKGENVDCESEYYGGEERSEHYYGYGDFQVRMKPAKIEGTASTFFTCTGPYDQWYNEDGTEVVKQNPHDEIDIEFLGKDTTMVQFNYFANGEGGHEYLYHLGFDASVEFHDYGYRWTENYITWFVDSKPVYRVDRKDNEAWPETPGRIIMNYWCGTDKATEWMGEFKDDYSGKAEYEYVATSATQCPDPNTAHIKDEPVTPPDTSDVPTEGWTDISTDGFDGWGMYAVDKTDGLTLSHSTAFGDYAYKCCGMDLADSYSWIKFKVKNNEDAEADARIDVKIKDADGSGAVEAVYSESENVSLIAAESAALIHLDANEEIEVALKMKDAYVNQVVVFFNSIKADNPETGSITITELQGIINEDVTPPEPPKPDDEPDDGWTAINLTGIAPYVPDGGENVYVYEKTANSVQITHSEKPANGSNLNVAPDYGNSKDVQMTIKNNLDADAKLCINVQSASWDYRTVIESAKVDGTAIDIPAIGNNWDGIVIDLPANTEILLEISLASGASNLCFGLNNMADGATTGDITITKVWMKTVESTVTEPEPVVGATLPEGEGWIGLDLTAMNLSVADTYTTVKGNADDNSLNTIQITHSEQMTEGAYPNVNMDVNYGTQNKLYMEIKNNSETAAAVKICVQEKTNYSNTMTSATVTRDGTSESITGIEWGASFTLAAGETVVFECVFDPSTGKTLAIVLNENPDGNAAESGDITVSHVAICK